MLGSPLPRTQSVLTRSLGPGSTRNSVSNRYSGPSRARAAAAVTSFTFDAGFIRASASLLNTTLPSSRLTSWSPAGRRGRGPLREVEERLLQGLAVRGLRWCGPCWTGDQAGAEERGS